MTAAKASPKSRKGRIAKATPSVSAVVAAQRAEVEDDIVTLEHCGVTLRIPIGGKTPIAAIDFYLVGDEYRGNKALLGEDQWNALVAAGATMDNIDEIGDKIKEAVGN